MGTGFKNSGAGDIWVFESNTDIGLFQRVSRGIHCFDTSSIGSGMQVDNAVFYFYPYNLKLNQSLEDVGMHVVPCSPASYLSPAASDYQNAFTKTDCGSILYSVWTLNVYNSITLNDTGKAVIDMEGVSAIGFINGWDLINDYLPPHYVSGGSDVFVARYYSADQPGTSQDPYIEVTYSEFVGGGGTPSLFFSNVF